MSDQLQPLPPSDPSESNILSAEVFSGGVIIDFADGTSVVFSSDFLYKQRRHAEQLSHRSDI